MNSTDSGPVPSVNEPERRRKARLTLLAVLAVCIAPVIASYTAYYLLPPDGRTNYGTLVSPMQEMAAVPVHPVVVPPAAPETRELPVEQSVATTLKAFRGRWVMIVVAPAACDDRCRDQLYKIRQVRLTTGKHRLRVERLWLIPADNPAAADTSPPDPAVLADHQGSWVARIDAQQVLPNFPVPADSEPSAHIYLMDPLGMLMMRFPVDADPNRMKKDLNKLLKASRVG